MFKKSPIGALEADLAALTKRGAGLEKRRDDAAAALLAATAERRRLLTEHDDPSAADLAKVDAAVRDAVDARDASVDALGEVDNRVAEVRSAIERLKATAECERQAVAIEASAKAADAAIDRIRKAAGEMDSARRDLVSALLPEAVDCYAPPSNPGDWGPRYLTKVLYFNDRGQPMPDDLDPEQVAARIVGHLVSGALPGLGIARLEDTNERKANGQPTSVLAPVDGNVARSLISDPMRAAAAKVRAGVAEMTSSNKAAHRSRAVRWTTDANGRATDSEGKLVDGLGFYVDEADAPVPAPPTSGTAPVYIREYLSPGVERLIPVAPEAA